jgi:hypothetical protein
MLESKKALATDKRFCYTETKTRRKESEMQICGRNFSQPEIDWIVHQVISRPELTRIDLSREFCRYRHWYKPDGGLKEMSCRVAMLRLERNGLIPLPVPRKKPNPVKAVNRTPRGEPGSDIHFDAGALSLFLEPVNRKSTSFWNELIDRYHYLGYCRMGGAQMRFFVRAGDQLLALLGFSAAAWRVAPRDSFIGWSDSARRAHLHRVVDNSRFLILPWVHGKNLASRILSTAARALPDLWQERYHYRPLLLETFVETPRFNGTCYKAANWTCVGKTRGRGKYDYTNAWGKPLKTIWLYPLDRKYKETLCR